jgi:hypothetical protein
VDQAGLQGVSPENIWLMYLIAYEDRGGCQSASGAVLHATDPDYHVTELQSAAGSLCNFSPPELGILEFDRQTGPLLLENPFLKVPVPSDK